MKGHRSLYSSLFFLLLLKQSLSFTTRSSPRFALKKATTSISAFASHKSRQWQPVTPQQQGAIFSKPRRMASSTSLSMSFNLPPSPEGGGNNNNELGDIAKGVLGLVGVVAFFASPLGGLVFGIFNSFLLLALLTPVIATIAFQAWQYFNTMSGNCPNCEAPVKVFKSKDGDAVPTVCYSCGAILQANYDNTAIDNVTGKNSVYDDISSPFGGGNSFFEVFGGGPATTATETTTTRTTTVIEEEDKKKKKIRREQTVIDVEIEDDKPFQ